MKGKLKKKKKNFVKTVSKNRIMHGIWATWGSEGSKWKRRACLSNAYICYSRNLFYRLIKPPLFLILLFASLGQKARVLSSLSLSTKSFLSHSSTSPSFLSLQSSSRYFLHFFRFSHNNFSLIFRFFFSLLTELILWWLNSKSRFFLLEMASAQLTASSISARTLPSFEGLRPSAAKFASVGQVKLAGINHRSFRGLVVKAATVVAPKVILALIIVACY